MRKMPSQQEGDRCQYCNGLEWVFCQYFGTAPCSPPANTPTSVPFLTNTPSSTSTPTATATPTLPPTPTSTPTDSPTVNPCSTRIMSPVFGSCDGCTPHTAGQGYNPPHRAIDLAPTGAFVQQFLPPDWATNAGTSQLATVYAVADGTILGPQVTGIRDEIVLRMNDTWEFVYVHIHPLVTSGFVTAGTAIGTVISHTDATTYVPEGHPSDEDHLHFGLRHPYDITQSLDPASCLPGLNGG